jgi:eukaryotic-like serine/threonine-protein kinase
MPFRTRVWGAGKLLFIAGALIATYVLFAAAAMRMAIKAREVQVPDLRGRSLRDATAMLADLGLTLKADDNRREDPKIPAGQIVQQEPSAGMTARRPRSVRVWVSLGKNAPTVPDLMGQTDRTAQVRLQQDGLALAVLDEIRSAEYPADVVVAQTPAAGARADRVSLLVNRADRGATFVMPDLIGVDGERAADYLRTRGFRVAVVGDHPYPGVPAGVVIRQTPAGGFQIAPGEAISLEVSR